MPEENKSSESQQEPQKEKESSNKNEELLNSISEEIKKISIIVTDGLPKIENEGENSNAELKTVSSSIAEVKETVNHISLTTDTQSDVQQQQIESLNSLIEETKESRNEIKGAIDKQTKEQSKISKKQMKLMASSNAELKTQNKGFKKLSKAMENFEGGGGGGGGLLGMLFNLGSLVMTVLGTVVSSIGSVFPGLLAAIAAVGGAKLIYDYLIKPSVDDLDKKLQKPLQRNIITEEPVVLEGGQKAFTKKDETGKLRVYTESEMKQELSGKKFETESDRLQAQAEFRPLVTQTYETEMSGKNEYMTGKRKSGEAISSEFGKGQTKEKIQQVVSEEEKGRDELERNKETPEGKEKIKRNRISGYLEYASILSENMRDDVKYLGTLLGEQYLSGGMDKLATWISQTNPVGIMAQKYEQKIKMGQSFLEDALKSGELTKEEYDAIKNASFIYSQPPVFIEHKFKRVIDAGSNRAGLFSGLTNVTSEDVKQAVLDASFVEWQKEDTYLGFTGLKSNEDYKNFLEASKRKDQESDRLKTESYNEAISQQFANEGVIKGSKYGSRIIAGENYTPEAVLSTNPNTITEKIGENLYETIKQKSNNDIMSLPKESIMIQDGLSRSKNEHYDMTVAQPLSSSGQGTSVVNNIVGGGTSDSRRDPNSQFNPSMLLLNNTETVSQQVLMEIKKAELL